jgi:hypothetical protein
MGDAHWRQVEKVVALIEQTLSPGSRIEHDVKLPDLTGVSDYRQCDIVIWEGKPPRETISIVEVQDRENKVDITTFDGWVEKMEKVGAQHLICVSREEFPDSIKKSAYMRGQTVRLITIRKLLDEKWPINILDNSMEFIHRNVIGTPVADIGVIKERLESINIENPVFEYKNMQYSKEQLFEKINTCILTIPEKVPQFELISFHLPEKEEKLFLINNDHKIEVTLDCEFAVENIFKTIPFTCSCYSQIDASNPLAWLMEASFMINNEVQYFKAILTLTEDNNISFKVIEKPSSLTLSINEIL